MSGTFLLHGLTVAAPFELPASRGGGAPDLEIALRVEELALTAARAETVILTQGDGAGALTLYRRPSDGRHWCSFADMALYTWTPLPSRLDICVPPNSDERLGELLLSSSVLAAVQSLRGKCVLHASAVTHDGRTLVFAGRSGSGKTTFAALACAQGARLLTDDALVLDDVPRWTAHRGTVQLRARQVIAEAPASWRAAPSLDGRLRYWPQPAAARVGLDAIVLLNPTARSGVTLRPLTPSAAFLPLTLAMRTLGFVDHSHQRRQFYWTGRLARELKVYELSYAAATPVEALADLCGLLLKGSYPSD